MPKDDTGLLSFLERSPHEAETVLGRSGRPVFETDETGIAVVGQPIEPCLPIHRAAPGLASALRVREVDVNDAVETTLEHVLGVLAHHRRMVDVVEQADLGAIDLVDDIETLDGRGEVVTRMVDAIIKRLERKHHARSFDDL